MSYQTTHLIGSESFELLSAEWDDLAQRGISNTPFQMLAYQRAWWTNLGQGTLHTLALRDEAGALLGLGCFYLHDGIIAFNGSKEESDYLDIVAPPENAHQLWEAVFETLLPKLHWHTLDLWNLSAESPTRSIVPLLANAKTYHCTEEVAELCPVITLPNSFDAYLDQLEKKQKQELKRKLRLAAGLEAKMVRINSAEQLPNDVNDFLDLLQKSTVAKNAWLNPSRTALFQETAEDALDKGILELLFLELEGERVATLFNFSYAGRTWVYNSGLDTSLEQLGAGTILTALSIQQAILRGDTHFDFLRGNEAYKYRFGAHDTPIYRLIVTSHLIHL